MKTNETGHYKNVVSLNALKVFAEGLGTGYAPQKDSLKLPSLILLVTETNALHNAVKDQANTVSLGVDARQLVYENVKPLSTKVINTMGLPMSIKKLLMMPNFLMLKFRVLGFQRKQRKKTVMKAALPTRFPDKATTASTKTSKA